MARIEDKTQEVIPYLQGRLIGFRVERGLTTFADRTNSVLGVETGYKDKARGSGKITSIDLTSGSLQRIDAEVPGIPILWTADIIFTIRYKANSHEERWAYPGDALIDNIWGSVDSAGTIKAILRSNPKPTAYWYLKLA